MPLIKKDFLSHLTMVNSARIIAIYNIFIKKSISYLLIHPNLPHGRKIVQILLY